MFPPASISDDWRRFKRELRALLGGHAKIAPQLEYLLQGEGKALRPQLLLSFCQLLGCQDEARFKLAVAAEYIHTASLIHDDIIDDALLRRGRPPLHHKWDVKTAILIGDFLYSRAFELICQTRHYSLLGLFANAANRLSISEINQLDAKQDAGLLADPERLRQQYLKVIHEKTAILFGVTCEAAAVMSMSDGPEARQARAAAFNYGINLGLLFQIRDDYLDYCSAAAESGKVRLQDLTEGKITLPLIYLYQLSDETVKNFIKEIIAKPQRTQEDLAKLDEMLQGSRALEMTMAKAREFAQLAETAITELSAEIPFIQGDKNSAAAGESLVYLVRKLSAA